MTQRIIITGGPGSGKTTLINALTERGFSCSAEVSRRLIRRESAREGGVLPWRSLPAFADLALAEMVREHDRAAASAAVVFFDRGVPDIFGYLRERGVPVPGTYYGAHSRCAYAREVFILPPWRAIYRKDEERPQSFAEAVALYRAIEAAYVALDYDLIHVPRLSCRQRVDFILAQLGADPPRTGPTGTIDRPRDT